MKMKGPWRTTASGDLRVRFRFPHQYFYGCYAGGCQGEKSFPSGSRAVIEFSVTPPGGTPGGTPLIEIERSLTVTVR